jgi:hypothetical protein
MLPGLKKHPDDSVTIYLQNKTPGKAKESSVPAGLSGCSFAP